jgi:Mg-chelatase subunit ChlD
MSVSSATSFAVALALIVGSAAAADAAPIARKRAINDSKAASSTRASSSRRVAPSSSRSKSSRSNSTRLAASRRTPKGKRTVARSFLPRWKTLPKVTRRRPGLFFLLVDGSGSMKEDFAPGVKKSESVAEVANNVLGSLVERFRSGNTVSDRLDVVALRYGGDQVVNAFDGSLNGTSGPVEISKLDSAQVDTVEQQDDEGNTFTAKTWLKPGAPGGNTPMAKGFGEALGSIKSWGRRPQDSEFLILGVHVSDGIFTDADPSDQLSELQDAARKQGGKLVMTNILLAKNGSTAKQILFPTPEEAESFDDAGKLLFKLSSPVPESLARSLGTRPGARMMAYNADPDGLEKVFVAGSSTAIE